MLTFPTRVPPVAEGEPHHAVLLGDLIDEAGIIIIIVAIIVIITTGVIIIIIIEVGVSTTTAHPCPTATKVTHTFRPGAFLRRCLGPEAMG